MVENVTSVNDSVNANTDSINSLSLTVEDNISDLENDLNNL